VDSVENVRLTRSRDVSFVPHDDPMWDRSARPVRSLPPTIGFSLRSRLRAAIVLAVVLLALVGRAPAGAASQVPSSGAWWGAYVQARAALSHYETVRRFERRLHRKLKIDHHYHDWKNLSLDEEKRDLSRGRIPLVSWPGGAWPAGVDAAAINSGSQDRVIRNAADKLKALGKPVFLRFAFEMDQPKPSPRHIGRPKAFKRAWQHVHEIMLARGATNVRFVWCAVASNFASGRAQHFYPGDRFVDWIAADGFSFYPVKLSSASRWRSFHEIFAAFYRWGAGRRPPLMVAATGVQEDARHPHRKARWFARAGDVMHTRMQQIKAFVYWNALHPTPNGDANFRAETSRVSFRAYRRMGHRAYFRP
jgi:hypothetical protein